MRGLVVFEIQQNKVRRIIHTILVVVLGLALFPPSLLACQSVCDTADCSFVGAEKPWPDRPAPSTSRFVIGVFELVLPDDWERLTVLPDEHLRVEYSTKKSLGLAWQSVHSVGIPKEPLVQSNLHFADVPRLIFTKAPCDVVLKNAAEREMWAALFDLKRMTFRNASDPRIYRSDPVTAYTARVNFGRYTSSTYITTSTFPTHALMLLGSGVDQETIDSIIGSVRLKGEFK